MKTIEAVVVVLIVALGVSVTLDYSLYTSNQQLSSALSNLNQEYNNSLTMLARYPWLFRGAYAVYSGQAQGISIGFLGIQPEPFVVNETVRLEVAEFNGTHVKWLFSYTNSSTFIMFSFDYNGDWIVPGEDYGIFGQSLTKINETDIFITGLGVRHCSIYQGDFFPAVYIDEQSGWPVKLQMSGNIHVSSPIELNMTGSNIPSLI